MFGEEVFLMIDYVHCLKLLRNVFASQNYLIDADGKKISWKFIKRLQEVQDENGLKLANKLTFRHVNFHDQKMKVNLASQVFSKSVADAINTLREIGDPQFVDSEGTENFLRIINDLFDIMNSRSPHAPGFKAPLSKWNSHISFDRLDSCFQYISKLRTEGNTLLTESRKRTGIIGFLLGIMSIKGIWNHIHDKANYLCTYRLCQDHLELLFNSIRRY